ncbi:MAG: glycosyltransferase [Patescibacteria group bacterium]|nr:glycosyltransferase [Patescibacteria group bacterium]
MARVSIIVNTVDRAEDLRRCLTSILKQTFRDFEIVIVNNGTGGETRGFLDEFRIKNQPARNALQSDAGGESRIKIVEDRTKKLSYLFNLGWKKSSPSSEYLAYLADDTEASPLYLNEAVRFLDEHPEAAAVSGPVLSTANPPGEMNYLYDLSQKNFLLRFLFKIYDYFVVENRLFEPGHWCQSGAFSLGAGIPQPQITQPVEVDLLTSTSMVIRRSALEQAKGFDENFLFNHADGDLFIRLKKFGYKLFFHPQVSVKHHMRFGPTRYPQILGRDTAFYYLKDVRPKSFKGCVGAIINLLVFNFYFVFKSVQTRSVGHLKGIGGFFRGILDFFKSGTEESFSVASSFSVFAAFLVLMFVIFRNVRVWGMLSYGDATSFPGNFQEAFRFFFQSFDPRSPQITMPQASVVLSTLIPLESALAFILGGSFIRAQFLYHYLPIPLSFLTMYWFTSHLVRSKPAKFLTALTYAGNPFMLAEFAGGFEGNLYIPALFPVLVVFLYRIYLKSAKNESAVRELLIYGLIQTFAYVLSDHVLILLTPFWLIFLIWPMFSKFDNKREIVFRNFIYLSASFALSLLLSAYHAFNYFSIALPFLSQRSLPNDITPFFVQNIWDTYWRMTPGNIVRLGGSYFADFFSAGDSWARAGFVIPFLAVVWPLFRRNRKGSRLKFGLFFSFLALFDIIFIYLTGKGITIPIFRALPFLFRFRNPSRLSLFLAFLYSPLIALSLDGWFSNLAGLLQRRRLIFISGFGLSVVVLGFLLFYLKGFFSGDFMLKENRQDNFWIKDRYYALGSFINSRHQEGGIFRTAYFPWDHEETEIKLFWADPYALGVPIEYGAYIRSDYLNYLKDVYQNVARGSSGSLAGLLAEGGVKYLVVNSRSLQTGPLLYRFDYHVPWLLGSAQNVQAVIDKAPNLVFVKKIDGFLIYQNNDFSPQKINLNKAGLNEGNKNFNDGLRRGLIFLAAVSWVFFIVVYIKVVRRGDRL